MVECCIPDTHDAQMISESICGPEPMPHGKRLTCRTPPSLLSCRKSIRYDLPTLHSERAMKNAFGIVGTVLTCGILLYVASTQLKSVTPGAGSVPADPRTTINLQGVKNDLLQFQKAEQQHLASEGHYVSFSDLHNDTGIPGDSRGPYNYDIEVSGTTFKVT